MGQEAVQVQTWAVRWSIFLQPLHIKMRDPKKHRLSCAKKREQDAGRMDSRTLIQSTTWVQTTLAFVWKLGGSRNSHRDTDLPCYGVLEYQPPHPHGVQLRWGMAGKSCLENGIRRGKQTDRLEHIPPAGFFIPWRKEGKKEKGGNKGAILHKASSLYRHIELLATP